MARGSTVPVDATHAAVSVTTPKRAEPAVLSTQRQGSEPIDGMESPYVAESRKLISTPAPKGGAPSNTNPPATDQQQASSSGNVFVSVLNDLGRGFLGVFSGLLGLIVAVVTVGQTPAHEALFGFSKFCFGIVEEADPYP